ncbi:hypothetical protein FA95DRAFT_1553054 [Auriscalpium vulgare]|uniref:Uncharacterized protein n=1 Tax=Auriscalpium vulgare TaxID=40419 RepID=A0ACB8S9E6_9AGAM|nr:hypothetical protein FA95DRAFT_1553054 [Auriscalpium vulgare]
MPDAFWKQCQACRDKRRRYNEQYKANQRAKKEQAQRIVRHVPQGHRTTASSPSPTPAVAPPRKKQKSDRVDKARSRAVGLGKTIAGLGDASNAMIAGKLAASETVVDCDEYLTADMAFSTLAQQLRRIASLPKPSFLNFRLTYVIIADPAIDNKTRIDLVVRALRASTSLRFSVNATPLTPGSSSYARPRSLGEKRRCKCMADKKHAPALPPGPAPLKRKQSDLSEWLAPGQDAAPASTTTCGGFVYISSEYDMSHPVGITGQRVFVTVTHPAV